MLLTVELDFVGDISGLLFSIGIGFIPGLMAYILLMRSANMEWERLEASNLLMFVSLINMIYLFSIFFIPDVSVTNPTQQDQDIAIGIILSLSLIDFLIPVFIFGIPILYVGIKNKTNYEGNYLILAGSLYIFSKFLGFIAYGLNKIQTLFYSLPLMYLAISSIGAAITTFIAYFCIIQFGLKMNNRLLSISGILLVCNAIGSIPYRLDIVSDVTIWIFLTIYLFALHQLIITKFGDKLTDLEKTISDMKVAEVNKGKDEDQELQEKRTS